MYQDQAAKTAPAPREPTLNERLNKVADTLQFQCERLESVLARVNGTPQAERAGRDKVVGISPTHAMANVVDMLEGGARRLDELTTNVEQIA